MSGIIYFAKAASGHIKIGFTTDLRQRMTALKTAVPGGVTLLASIPGTVAVESWLHGQLRAARVTGEWFHPAPDVLALVERTKREGQAIVPAELLAPMPEAKTIADEIKQRAMFYLRVLGACNAPVQQQIIRAGAATGLSQGRVQDLWYGEARRIDAWEFVVIKSAFDDLNVSLRSDGFSLRSSK